MSDPANSTVTAPDANAPTAAVVDANAPAAAVVEKQPELADPRYVLREEFEAFKADLDATLKGVSDSLASVSDELDAIGAEMNDLSAAARRVNHSGTGALAERLEKLEQRLRHML